MDLAWRRVRVPLARPFKIATGVSDHAEVVIAQVSERGVTGYGEAAPSLRVTGETLETVEQFLAWAREEFRERRADDWEGFLDHLHENICGNAAARAAVDIAVHDLVGKLRGVPVHALYGLPPARLETVMTISLDAPEVMAAEARDYHARGFRCLKVKLGEAERDEARARAVREAVPRAALRADANTAWSRADAPRLLGALADLGFEFVEQPFPASDREGLAEASRASPLPIYADESVLDVHDVERLRKLDFRGGVNLKLMKTGGIRAAVAAARLARDCGYPVQFGCMVETGVGIAAATQLLALADHADLDGNSLLREDPFRGPKPSEGWMATPRGLGLGLPNPS